MRKLTIDISRRRLLRGAGGFTLALPFLPSLATPAFAADPVFTRPKRFVAIRSEHGAIFQTNMFPAAATLTDKVALYPGHDVWKGTLQRKLDGQDAFVSPVLRGSASVLTDRLVAKMNVLHGLDVPFYLGHNLGGDFGNYATTFGGAVEQLKGKETPTIDQVLAWSPSFYPNLNGIRERAIVAGDWLGISWNYSNPANKTGAVQPVSMSTSALDIFDRIFDPMRAAGAAPRKPVVDKVMDAYKALRNGNKRLSGGDRQRLDDYVERLAELDRKLNVNLAFCSTVKRPNEADWKALGQTTTDGDTSRDPDKATKKWHMMNDVIAAAFMCGTSRVAVERVIENFSWTKEDWHQKVAHQWTDAAPQQLLTDAARLHFQATTLDLAAKLDVEEAPGMTYLDNTLIAWSQESGQSTHDPVSIPVVTFGSAGGFFKTGLYCRYQNRVPSSRFSTTPVGNELYNGVTYNQWLGTVAQAMGLPRSEYELPGTPGGFGQMYVQTDYRPKYVSGVLEGAGKLLPLVTA